MIRVLVADDQTMVLEALVTLLGLQPDIDVVASCTDGSSVPAAVAEYEPDVCVLDIDMPGLSGLDLLDVLHKSHPHIPCLIATTFGRPGYVRRAMERGARGFLTKDSPAAQLAAAIRRVHAGEIVVDPGLAVASMASGNNPLTEREQAVLREVLTGLGAQEIARALHLSSGTVRNHISHAMTKMHAATRIEAALRAQESGWL